MKRSFSVVTATFCMMGALLAAEEPAKKTEPIKPPWQRMLQGEDAKKAAEQEKRRTELQEAGKSWTFTAELLPSISGPNGRIVRLRRLSRAR